MLLLLASAALLQTQIGQIAQQAHGRVGVSAMLIETGESVSFDGTGRYPMQSVYKFPIAMAVLDQVDKGKLRLDQSVRITKDDYVGRAQHSPIRDKYPEGTTMPLRDVLRYNVSESDGSACDVLLRLLGGASTVQRYVASLGVDGMTILSTEKEIGSEVSVQYKNYSTPLASVQLLKAFQEGRGLSPSSREVLRRMMIETETGLKRLKGTLPPRTEVAHKTGTSGTTDGLTHATNDIGIVTLPTGKHLAIAVYVSDSRASQEVRERVIATIARAAWDYWIGQEGPLSK